jgi:hypothetical protein
MKKIMAIFGLAAVLSFANAGFVNAANNDLTKKCRVKKTGDNKWKFKGKRCDRVVKGKFDNDSYYYY